jgi:hypothetical protein
MKAVFSRPERPNPRPRDLESRASPKAHHVSNPHQLTPPIAFLHLTIEQLCRHLPLVYFPASTNHFKPLSKMSRQSIEVHIQAVTGEERKATRSQELSQGVNNHMRHVLRARTQVEDRNGLRQGIGCQPQPQHLRGAAEPCSQFIQLQVRELEVEERVLVQRLSVLPSTSQPGGDGSMAVAEDPLSGREIQPTSRGQSAPRRLAGRGFSNGREGYAVGQ